MYSNSIEVLEDLVEWSEAELMKIKGFGETALQRIKNGLLVFGHKLRQSDSQKQS